MVNFELVKKDIIKKYHNKKIGIAVSGGVDSMVLLHNLAFLKEDITAINIDHMIRKENEKDFVQKFCKEIGCKFLFFRTNIIEYAKKHRIGIEEAARIERYRILSELDFHIILLAQHKNDKIETILLNLFRGAGYVGIASMKDTKDNKFYRPFMDITKKQIQEYAKKYRVPFCHDYTNDDNSYSRNFLRNKVIPCIQEKFCLDSILTFYNIAKETEDYFCKLLSNDIEKIDNNIPCFEVDILNKEYAIASRYCYYGLKKIGVKNISYSMISNIIELSKLQNGKKFCFSDFEIVKEYDIIRFINKQQEEFYEKKFFLKELKADAEKLEGAVERTRKEGDFFIPFGSKNKKSLKKYLIEKKVPVCVRNKIKLFCKGHEVLVINGIEISDKVKVDTNTKNIKYFKLEGSSNETIV